MSRELTELTIPPQGRLFAAALFAAARKAVIVQFAGVFMERETGIEPATNGLGSRDSTTELLPLREISFVLQSTPSFFRFVPKTWAAG